MTHLKTNTMDTEVYVQVTAFDKNSNDNFGRSINADTKESFNQQVEELAYLTGDELRLLTLYRETIETDKRMILEVAKATTKTDKVDLVNRFKTLRIND